MTTERIYFDPPEVTELQGLLSGYTVNYLIASGGMGAVYQGTQNSLDRPVAIKILPAAFGEDVQFRESFEAEAKLMAHLNHPNLVGIYDYGSAEDMPYIIMEYVDGESLHEASGGHAIGANEAATYIRDVALGLDHAHQAGILHRDIKPSNILITKSGEAKIVDFGLARNQGQSETDSVIYGTLGYAAPEVTHNPEAVDQRTDIFALGVMFYKLLTGNMPAVAGEPYIPASQYALVNASFDRIIRKATHPDIDQRFKSAAEVASAISPLIHQNIASAAAQKTSPLFAQGNSSQNLIKPRHRPVAKKSTSSPLASLFIIGILCAAIYFTLQWKKQKEVNVKQIEHAGTEKVMPKEPTATSAASGKPDVNQQIVSSPSQESSPSARPTTPSNEPATPKLPPMEQLAALKDRLFSGERPAAEMPSTAFARDNNARILMYINTPMTWHEAQHWAQQHGAFLAVCKSSADLTNLSTKIPQDVQQVWLGGASAGSTGWTWIDGSAWDERIAPPKSSGPSYLTLDRTSTLATEDIGQQHPFFIEWRMDGTNPSLLKEQFKRTAQTLDKPNTRFPVGTFKLGGRNYYICKSQATHAEAIALAQSAGGQLIVPSSDDELYLIEKIATQYMKANTKAWVGGQKSGSQWQWITKEPWLPITWVVEKGNHTGLCLLNVAGQAAYADRDPNEKNAFLIEWSDDATSR